MGAYGQWTSGDWTIKGDLSYGASEVDSRRSIPIGSLREEAYARYWTHHASSTGQVGYGFALTDALTVGPIVGFDLDWTRHDGFIETGAGSLNVTIDEASVWTAETVLGINAAYEVDGDYGPFVLTGNSLWLHKWADATALGSVQQSGQRQTS